MYVLHLRKEAKNENRLDFREVMRKYAIEIFRVLEISLKATCGPRSVRPGQV